MKNSKNFAPAAGKMGGSLKRGIFTFQNQGSGSLKWVAQLSGAPLYCHSTLEAIYYSNSLGPLRCYKCGTDVSEIQELITKRDTLLKDYFLVHPSCPECGPNFFKMRKRQRPQAGKQKSVKKTAM